MAMAMYRKIMKEYDRFATRIKIKDKRHFINEMTTSEEKLLQRLWEIILGNYLLDLEYLVVYNHIGPDFQLYINGRKFYLECVVPTTSDLKGAEYYKQRNRPGVVDFPDNGIALRCASVIKDKINKL